MVVLAGLLVAERRGRPPAHKSHGRRALTSHWAGPRELGPLRCPPRTPGRLVVGRPGRAAPWLRVEGRRVLAVERAQSLAVVGPTQSGKTSSCAVPAILEWDGPVLAASVKTDLLRDTIAWRRSLGTVWCFDPAGTTGLVSDPWDPLRGARTWAGARRLAADLTEVTRSRESTADAEFWYATATKLLAPLVFAAAVDGRSMSDVVRWVDTQERHEVVAIVEASGQREPLQALQASWARDDRQQSSVYTTAETVLEGFADAAPPAAGPRGPIDAAELLRGRHTLYLCAPAHDQRRLQSLFVALVKEVVHTAFATSTRRGAPLSPPLLVVLDEAANIAPLAELDSLAATCAGHGVQLLTVWQDLAQVAARYGRRAPTVVNNHRAKLFLSGISDPDTLEHAARLVGEEEVLVPSVTRGRGGERSTTMSVQRRALLSASSVRRLAAGTAVLVYGSLPPVRVTLRPWWSDRVLAGRVGRTGPPSTPTAMGAATSARGPRSLANSEVNGGQEEEDRDERRRDRARRRRDRRGGGRLAASLHARHRHRWDRVEGVGSRRGGRHGGRPGEDPDDVPTAS